MQGSRPGADNAKESDSGLPAVLAQWSHPNPGDYQEAHTMSNQTCAACDYELDGNAIQVKIGGKTVEVCCEECAEKLREAQASAAPGH